MNTMKLIRYLVGVCLALAAVFGTSTAQAEPEPAAAVEVVAVETVELLGITYDVDLNVQATGCYAAWSTQWAYSNCASGAHRTRASVQRGGVVYTAQSGCGYGYVWLTVPTGSSIRYAWAVGC